MSNEIVTVIISVVGGSILGSIGTLIVGKKLKERKSLAYEILSKMSLIDVKDEVKKKIKIQYEEFPADNIFSFKIRIVNDGTAALKDQPILFEFPKGTITLETKIDTKPKMEFGPIAWLKKGEGDFHLERFQIGMMNPKEEVEFDFLTINNVNDAVKVHCKGENLRFHQIDPQKRAQKEKNITNAVFWIPFALFILGGILSLIFKEKKYFEVLAWPLILLLAGGGIILIYVFIIDPIIRFGKQKVT
ncbi:MAG: hypothetical protein RBG1_1C00001G0277 [candidate division Zixibacteria bacterium RBG-1]|nr:MAG: hypothetical protein RBG1_1C00001G0277 [candidate division Zixibacteria bacterium RBG-1]